MGSFKETAKQIISQYSGHKDFEVVETRRDPKVQGLTAVKTSIKVCKGIVAGYIINTYDNEIDDEFEIETDKSLRS